MDCIICKTEMAIYFSKQVDYHCLGRVDYWQCPHCGCVVSRTHFELPEDTWQALNEHFHTDVPMMVDNPRNRPAPTEQQAQMLCTLHRFSLLSRERPWLDWGAGGAQLARHLRSTCRLEMLSFDRYLPLDDGYLAESQLAPRGYDLVVSSAVFEHVRSRRTLDEIESCVSGEGALAVHTVVRGAIPRDPEWFYLLPAHCTFHTNRSMQVLMDQWGYTCSVYNEHAKLWVLFRRSPDEVLGRVVEANRVLGHELLHFKRGFMDYWP